MSNGVGHSKDTGFNSLIFFSAPGSYIGNLLRVLVASNRFYLIRRSSSDKGNMMPFAKESSLA
jgi:hypothetical protein